MPEGSRPYVREARCGRLVDLAAVSRRHDAILVAPRTHLILVENLVRHGWVAGADQGELDDSIAQLLAGRGSHAFYPHRVVLQDASGVPALLDIAALRDAMQDIGGDPSRIGPSLQVDLVVDHSILAHDTGPGSHRRNLDTEYADNAERYGFLRWAERNFDRLSIVPPGNGIVHQINLERLASGIARENGWVFPETVLGADSHTPMVNGLGVLGWGIGGIEATAIMLGNPVDLVAQPVVGIEVIGKPRPGLMTMDVALELARRLRAFGVVGCFLDMSGPGLDHLSVEDRATIANMTPEYGATATLFPLDDIAFRYLDATGRPEAASLGRQFLSEVPLYGRAHDAARRYARKLTIDLGEMAPVVAGPSLPHQVRSIGAPGPRNAGRADGVLSDGDIVLAAITSCTNTSNPRAMIAAGLLARRAVELGLRPSSRIKTSLSPGSRTVVAYLEKLGLLEPLESLGFANAGYGCMTCVGNSGELDRAIAGEIESRDLDVAAVLSGNRNFQGRIHPLVRSAFLASPPLVIAYALAGRIDIDLVSEPLGVGTDGDVWLSDIWPGESEISAALERAAETLASPEPLARERWDRLPAPEGTCFPWPDQSTYLVKPRFAPAPRRTSTLENARALLLLGDNVTTDHISPVGRIALDSPAGKLLSGLGIARSDFNTYGSRRGNAPLMRLGTFANPNLPNRLSADRPGNWTRHHPSATLMPIPEASSRYAEEGTPLIIVAGSQYGIGSARDWAAKGTRELGVAVVLAQSYERIHRANLALVGVLPLQWDEPVELSGDEVFHIDIGPDALAPGCAVPLRIETAAGSRTVHVTCRLDTRAELAFYRNGGFLAQTLSRLN